MLLMKVVSQLWNICFYFQSKTLELLETLEIWPSFIISKKKKTLNFYKLPYLYTIHILAYCFGRKDSVHEILHFLPVTRDDV